MASGTALTPSASYPAAEIASRIASMVVLVGTKITVAIFVSKSKYYYWVFTGCKLLDVSVHQDKNFTDYRDRNIEKFDSIISISYGDVYGSNNKNLVDRDIKLKQLFG